MPMTKVKIYSDGACSGNPGPGGYGAIVIYNDQYVVEISGYDKATTNNRMELAGIIHALQTTFNAVGEDVHIDAYTDSVYVIRGITQWVFGWIKNGWKNAEGADVTNKDLWIELFTIVKKIKSKIQWQYVRGHNGDHGNERCDRIAVAMSKNEFVDLYQGDAKHYYFDVTLSPKTESIPENNWSKPSVQKKSWYLSLVNGVVAKDESWSQCEARVKGQSGAKFKKVSSQDEEVALLKSWGKF